MPLEIVEVMDQVPGTCLLCSGTPTKDGEPLPAIHAVGLDVNWGQSVYICNECAHIIADLCDRVTREEHQALQQDYRKSERTNARLSQKLAKRNNQLRRITDGKKAEKEVKRSAKSSKLRAKR